MSLFYPLSNVCLDPKRLADPLGKDVIVHPSGESSLLIAQCRILRTPRLGSWSFPQMGLATLMSHGPALKALQIIYFFALKAT
jgi:hypothetical protein